MIRPLAIAALLSTLAACSGSPSTSPSPAPSPAFEAVDNEGCEHLAGGPAVAVTAVAEAGPVTPSVSNDHKRYDLSLGANGGVVKFQSAVATTYALFTSAKATVAVTDATGAPIALGHTATGSAACTAIQGRYEVDLGVGVYYFKLSAPGGAVNLVLEAADEEAGHDHD